MNIKALEPDVPRFENDPRDWDWEAASKECRENEASAGDDPGGDPFHALFFGSVMSIMPSGKYWTCFASSNVTESEQEEDVTYHELLEACASEAGGWIENGLNGDYCDMFFCLPVEESNQLELDLDESMDGDHDSAMASAGFGTDEDYGGCDEHY
jgi:hypothetical protein